MRSAACCDAGRAHAQLREPVAASADASAPLDPASRRRASAIDRSDGDVAGRAVAAVSAQTRPRSRWPLTSRVAARFRGSGGGGSCDPRRQVQQIVAMVAALTLEGAGPPLQLVAPRRVAAAARPAAAASAIAAALGSAERVGRVRRSSRSRAILRRRRGRPASRPLAVRRRPRATSSRTSQRVAQPGEDARRQDRRRRPVPADPLRSTSRWPARLPLSTVETYSGRQRLERARVVPVVEVAAVALHAAPASPKRLARAVEQPRRRDSSRSRRRPGSPAAPGRCWSGWCAVATTGRRMLLEVVRRQPVVLRGRRRSRRTARSVARSLCRKTPLRGRERGRRGGAAAGSATRRATGDDEPQRQQRRRRQRATAGRSATSATAIAATASAGANHIDRNEAGQIVRGGRAGRRWRSSTPAGCACVDEHPRQRAARSRRG